MAVSEQKTRFVFDPYKIAREQDRREVLERNTEHLTHERSSVVALQRAQSGSNGPVQRGEHKMRPVRKIK